VFGGDLRTYSDADSLVAALSGDRDEQFPSRQDRLDMAARVARDHSFDARAAVLVERALELRGRR
jgi:O-antigen biosynthesis protein